MDFKKLYEEKLITAKEAAAMVKDGDWVEMGWSALTPVDFDKALAERVNELKDVKVRGGILAYNSPTATADPTGEHITYHSWHSSGIERKLINSKDSKSCSFSIPS